MDRIDACDVVAFAQRWNIQTVAVPLIFSHARRHNVRTREHRNASRHKLIVNEKLYLDMLRRIITIYCPACDGLGRRFPPALEVRRERDEEENHSQCANQ